MRRPFIALASALTLALITHPGPLHAARTLTAVWSGPTRSDLLAIRGATLWDGTGRAPQRDSLVLIRGNRILSVGKAGGPIPSGARVLTAPAESWLLPGFIDMHVHSSVHPGMMPYFLANGVTTVRDLGCADDKLKSVLQYRADALSGKRIGPRLYASGPPLDGIPRAASWFPGPSAKTPDEAQSAVESLADQGVDLIKLYRRLEPDAARGAIEAAHRRGLAVTWDYQWNPRYLSDALKSGADGVEHVFFSERATREEVEQLAELIGVNKVWFDPTLVAFRPPDTEVVTDPDYEQLPPSLPRFWRRLFWPMETDSEFATMKSFVRLARRYGARVLVGTDSPVKWSAPGYAFHHEMRILTECGMSNLEVLKAATRSAAQALRKETELGSVEPGKLADLLLVAGDPLKDLSAARQMQWVIVDGRPHQPSRLTSDGRIAGNIPVPSMPPHTHGM